MDQFNGLPQLQRIALLFIPFVIIAFVVINVWRTNLAQKLRQSYNKHGYPSSQIVATYLTYRQQHLQSPLSSILPQSLLYDNSVIASLEAMQIIINHNQKGLNMFTKVGKSLLLSLVISFYVSAGFMVSSAFEFRSVNAVLISFYAAFLLVILLGLINIIRNDMIQTMLIKRLAVIEQEDSVDVGTFLFLDAIRVGDWFYTLIPLLLAFIVPIRGRRQ